MSEGWSCATHSAPRGRPQEPTASQNTATPAMEEGKGPQWVVWLGGMGWGRWPQTWNTTMLCSREGAQLPWSWDLQTLKPFPVMLGTESLATYQGRGSLAAYLGRSSLTSYSGLSPSTFVDVAGEYIPVNYLREWISVAPSNNKGNHPAVELGCKRV